MRIKDYTDTVRHLTDSFNIPEARRMIQENPALSREQFAEGQLVQPGPGRPGYGKTSGIGTRVKAIEDPNVIKQAEDILKPLIEKKHGHKVLDWKGGVRGKYNQEDLFKLLQKKLPYKRINLLDIIDTVSKKNGWLDGGTYKNTMVVETFMDDYARNSYFTGKEKTSDLLKEFRGEEKKKYETINKTFKKWKDGDIIVEGYDINDLEKETLEALDDWSPTTAGERSIDKTKQLQFLDDLNKIKKLKLDKAKARFYKEFPDASKKAFQYRMDQLYQLKVEGRISAGENTFKTHDIVKGERSDWLKLGKRNNRAGNYSKLLIAADELDDAGNSKLATRFRNAAVKHFSPNSGIISKMGGEADHPWFRTQGGKLGQLKIDSLVSGNLNVFKNLNFEAPIEKLRKEYVNASPERKIKIQKLIENRQMWFDDLTGGMTKNVKFSFPGNEVKVTHSTKPIDRLTMRELVRLKPKGAAFEKNILSKGKGLGLLTEQGTLIRKQITDKNVLQMLTSAGFEDVGDCV